MQDLCGKGGCSGKALGVMLWHYARSLDGWEVLVNGRGKCYTAPVGRGKRSRALVCVSRRTAFMYVDAAMKLEVQSYRHMFSLR